LHAVGTGLAIAFGRGRRLGAGAIVCAVMLAIAAPGATALRGLPLVGRCVSAGGQGLFTDSRCITTSPSRTGGFEFVEGAGPRPAFSASVSGAVLETAAGARVACGASELRGEWRGRPTEPYDTNEPALGLNFALDGCHNRAGAACQTSAATPGEIATVSPVDGELGYISEPLERRLRVGLDLVGAEPEELSPLSFSFICGEAPETSGVETWTIEGSVIGQIKPLETMASTYALVIRARGASQLPEAFRGGAADTLTATRVLQSQARTEAVGLTLHGERRSIKLRSEEAIEIKARG
jgi:hypothetical protein